MKKYTQIMNEAKSVIAAAKMANEGEGSEYEAFFRATLKKFGKSGVNDMTDEEKKKFFNYIEKNYTGEKTVNEQDEMEDENKDLAKVWKRAEPAVIAKESYSNSSKSGSKKKSGFDLRGYYAIHREEKTNKIKVAGPYSSETQAYDYYYCDTDILPGDVLDILTGSELRKSKYKSIKISEP
jgi:hypothetical protein